MTALAAAAGIPLVIATMAKSCGGEIASELPFAESFGTCDQQRMRTAAERRP
jgi:hypothetical protein